MMTRHGYPTFWRLGLIGLLALLTVACGGSGSDKPASPASVLSASFTQQVSGLDVSLDASASTGNIASYQWDFGDGTTGTGKTASHSYAAAGTYTVALTVTDGKGATASQSVSVSLALATAKLAGRAMLGGNLQGADVKLYLLSASGATLISEPANTASDGSFEITTAAVRANDWYLLSATGGLDTDGDGDGIPDATGLSNAGEVSVIASGRMLQENRDNLVLSPLTDLVTQGVGGKSALTVFTAEQLASRIETVIALYLSDLSGDGLVDATDLLRFVPSDASSLKVSYPAIIHNYLPMIRGNATALAREVAILELLPPSASVVGGALQTAPAKVSGSMANLGVGQVEWQLAGSQASAFTLSDAGTYSLVAKVHSLSEPKTVIAQELQTVVVVAPTTVQSATVVAGDSTLLALPAAESDEIAHALSGTLITIPDGAAEVGTQITASIAPGSFIPGDDYQSVGDVLVLGPSGLQFKQPISIEMPYAGSQQDAKSLLVARYSSGGALDYIQPDYVDDVRHVVGFTTEHFTSFQLKKNVFSQSSTEEKLAEIQSKFPALKYDEPTWITLLNYKPVSTGSAPTIYDIYQTWQVRERLQQILAGNDLPYINAYRDFYGQDELQYKSAFKVVQQVVDFPGTVAGYYGDAQDVYSAVRGRWDKVLFSLASGIVDDANFTDWYLGELLDKADGVLVDFGDITTNQQIRYYFTLRESGESSAALINGLKKTSTTTKILEISDLNGKALASNGWFYIDGNRPLDPPSADLWNRVEFLYQQTHAVSPLAQADVQALFTAAKANLDLAKNPYTTMEFGWADHNGHLDGNRYQVCSGSTLDFELTLQPYGKTLTNPTLQVRDQNNQITKVANCENSANSNAWSCQVKRSYTSGFTKIEEKKYTVEMMGAPDVKSEYSVLVKPTSSVSITGLHVGTLYTYGDYYQLPYNAMFANGAYLSSKVELFDNNNLPIFLENGTIYLPKDKYGKSEYDQVRVVITPQADESSCRTAVRYQGSINLNALIKDRLDAVHQEITLKLDSVNGIPGYPVLAGEVTISRGDKVTLSAALPLSSTLEMFDIDGDSQMTKTFDGQLASGSGGRYFTKAFATNGTYYPKIMYRVDGVMHLAKGPTIKVVDDSNNPPTDTAAVKPVANAGADITINDGETANLNGAASSDSDGFIVSYEWWLAGQLQGSSSRLTLSKLAVGSHVATLKVRDNQGLVASDTVTIVVKALPPRLDVSASTLDFGSAAYDIKGAQFASKGLTISNGGGQPLTNIKPVLASNTGGFTLNDVGSFTLAPGAKRQLTLSAAPKTIGEFSANLQITADGGFSKSVTLKSRVNANDLVHRVIPSATSLVVGDTLVLRVEMTSGNPEYQVSVEWGDGKVDRYTSQSTSLAVSHVYSAAATPTVKVVIDDVGGKHGETSVPLTISGSMPSSTRWSAQAHHIESDEFAANVPISVSAETLDEHPVQRYSTSWAPQKGSNDEYFIKYRLPIPSGLIKLSHKARLTVVVSPSTIAAYDRELAFVTDQGELIAGWLGETEPVVPGYLQFKPFASDLIRNEPTGALNDDPLLHPQQSLALEWQANQLQAQHYAGGSYTPLATMNSLSGSTLNEINLSFKGNGAIWLVKFEYDADNNGQYDDGAIFANTANQQVDWSIYTGVTPPPVTASRLNDTGITSCADASSWSLPCPVADFPGQDAESGRDVSANDDSDGHAGFSFTKVSSSGEALATSAPEWSCVKDNVTGLLWELHTDDGGLRDKDNTYSWYNPDATTNGGDAGTQNGGYCSGGISCDTQGYVAAVNAAGLCGYHDWRLPTVLELQGLVDYSIPEPGPTIDTNFFPDTQQNWYWSSSAVAGHPDLAWSVYFGNGYASWVNEDGFNFQLRLVRSGQ